MPLKFYISLIRPQVICGQFQFPQIIFDQQLILLIGTYETSGHL